MLIVPVPAGLSVHVTLVFAEPVTVAVNCCVAPCPSADAVGFMLTATGGFSVTTALADLVASATLVAVTVTLCWELTLAGAV